MSSLHANVIDRSRYSVVLVTFACKMPCEGRCSRLSFRIDWASHNASLRWMPKTIPISLDTGCVGFDESCRQHKLRGGKCNFGATVRQAFQTAVALEPIHCSALLSAILEISLGHHVRSSVLRQAIPPSDQAICKGLLRLRRYTMRGLKSDTESEDFPSIEIVKTRSSDRSILLLQQRRWATHGQVVLRKRPLNLQITRNVEQGIRLLLSVPDLCPKCMRIRWWTKIQTAVQIALEVLQLLGDLLCKLCVTSVFHANACFDHVSPAGVKDLQVREAWWRPFQ